ncbi:hypothetical protein MFRU_004g02830 [Monilinia fructicola]|nr:hypothetical protein MFRU_004g02830 [Monilinia fructicola]
MLAVAKRREKVLGGDLFTAGRAGSRLASLAIGLEPDFVFWATLARDDVSRGTMKVGRTLGLFFVRISHRFQGRDQREPRHGGFHETSPFLVEC